LIDYGLSREEFSGLFWYPPKDGNWLEHYVLERISVETPDARTFIRCLSDAPAFTFVANEWVRQNLYGRNKKEIPELAAGCVDLADIPFIESYCRSKIPPDERDSVLDALKGIFGKRLDLSIDDYVAACVKLAGVGVIDDADYERCTSVNFRFFFENDEKPGIMRGTLYFSRPSAGHGAVRLALRVSYRTRERFCRQFGLPWNV
jgi:hypothetical protein